MASITLPYLNSGVLYKDVFQTINQSPLGLINSLKKVGPLVLKDEIKIQWGKRWRKMCCTGNQLCSLISKQYQCKKKKNGLYTCQRTMWVRWAFALHTCHLEIAIFMSGASQAEKRKWVWYKTWIKSRPSDSLNHICPYHMGYHVVVWAQSNCMEGYLLVYIKEKMEIHCVCFLRLMPILQLYWMFLWSCWIDNLDHLTDNSPF